MGTGRKFNKKPVSRPKKAPGERRRRDKVQRGRLVTAGRDAEVVRKMTMKEVRDLLKRPKALEAQAS